jgi:hypothetical protein
VVVSSSSHRYLPAPCGPGNCTAVVACSPNDKLGTEHDRLLNNYWTAVIVAAAAAAAVVTCEGPAQLLPCLQFIACHICTSRHVLGGFVLVGLRGCSITVVVRWRWWLRCLNCHRPVGCGLLRLLLGLWVTIAETTVTL